MLAVTSANVKLGMFGSSMKHPVENLLTNLPILPGPVELNTTEEAIHPADARRERESKMRTAFASCPACLQPLLSML